MDLELRHFKSITLIQIQIQVSKRNLGVMRKSKNWT